MPVQENPEDVLCRQESAVPVVEDQREDVPAAQNQAGEDQGACSRKAPRKSKSERIFVEDMIRIRWISAF